MNKVLILIDCQNDFIDGALYNADAVAKLPRIAEKIKGWDGDILLTADTHDESYLSTNEGKHLPVAHCIKGTKGWELSETVAKALAEKTAAGTKSELFEKNTFGSVALAEHLKNSGYDHIEFIGFCTDICVVSNALMTKAYCPEREIAVDASCCAGVTKALHEAALATMKSCHIEVTGE